MRYISSVQRLFRYISPAVVAASGVLIITIVALFIRPFIGMADNGDFFRNIYSNGLYFSLPDYDAQYLGYFVKDYGIFQYYNENPATLFSSQSIFIKAAILLNQLFYSAEQFDIRIQAALYLVLYVIAVYLLVEALTWKVSAKRGYIIALCAIFLFADTAYTAYFNSFFGESIVWISTILVLASGLLIWRRRYNDYLMLIIFVVSAIILTTSKQQNAPVGMIVALLGIFLIFIRTKRNYRLFISVVLLGVFMVGVGTYVLIPKEFVNINKYHAMTRGALLYSENPEDTLQGFGIDRQFAVLNGAIHYLPYTTVDVDSELLEELFYSKYGFFSILGHYITHPNQAANMLNVAARNGFKIRPPAMGNYEKAAGKQFGAQTTFFSGFSILKEKLTPKTFGFVVIWMIVILGCYMPYFIKAVLLRNARMQLRLGVIVMMIAMGLSGIFVSIIGAGDADLAKHLFLFTSTFDLVSLVFVADLIGARLWGIDDVTSDDGRGGGGISYAPEVQNAYARQA